MNYINVNILEGTGKRNVSWREGEGSIDFCGDSCCEEPPRTTCRGVEPYPPLHGLISPFPLTQWTNYQTIKTPHDPPFEG